MKAVCLVFVVGCFANAARAQYPEQFYTNGIRIDAWRPEPGQKSTLWFSRQPGDKISYRSSLAVIYDHDPEYAYYIDLGTKKFIGKYSYELGKYFLLAEAARREDIKDIPKDAFRELPGMPTIDQLLTDSQNKTKLLTPPPTKEYPRLRTSSWDSVYLTADRRRVVARITFNDDRGAYTAQADGQELRGVFEGVHYDKTGNGIIVITGKWSLLNQSGYFRFELASDNLNGFQGEWGCQGKIEGTWNGTRIRGE